MGDSPKVTACKLMESLLDYIDIATFKLGSMILTIANQSA